MCFSLVFACLSVRWSVWGLDLRSLAPPLPQPPPLPTLGAEPGIGLGPSLGGSQQAGPGPQPPLWLQSPVCVYVYVCVCTLCMYTGNLCASMYKGEGHITEVGRWSCSRKGLPGVASSQVDSPKVSRRCDGVALRTELLGTQGPQPALLTVHMPTLDGR